MAECEMRERFCCDVCRTPIGPRGTVNAQSPGERGATPYYLCVAHVGDLRPAGAVPAEFYRLWRTSKEQQ